jgi:hypothetical protein
MTQQIQISEELRNEILTDLVVKAAARKIAAGQTLEESINSAIAELIAEV